MRPDDLRARLAAALEPHTHNGHLVDAEVGNVVEAVLKVLEPPRPFLSSAMHEVQPGILEEFQKRWAEAISNWDGTLVVVEPAKAAHVEWEVRYDDGTLSGAVLLDEEDARQLAARRADRNPTIVYRTIGQWQEVPNGR